MVVNDWLREKMEGFPLQEMRENNSDDSSGVGKTTSVSEAVVESESKKLNGEETSERVTGKLRKKKEKPEKVFKSLSKEAQLGKYDKT